MLDDPDLRRVRHAGFDYAAGVLAKLDPGGLYTLRGPRRVGKTVEVKKTVQRLIEDGTDPRLVLYMAADGLDAHDLRTLVEAANVVTPAVGRRTWFIDEVTAISDGWPAEVKWLRDNDSRFSMDTVVLTESSASDLGESIDALAGRRGRGRGKILDADRVLLPMSFRDFLRATVGADRLPADTRPFPPEELGSEEFDHRAMEIAPWLDTLAAGWDAYMRIGGFPPAVDSHIKGVDDERFRQDLLNLLHGEALRRTRWSKSQTDFFVRRLAKGIGSPANWSQIAADIGGKAGLVRRRVAALQDEFVVWTCHREDRLRPRRRAQAKVYFTDPVFARLTQHPEALDAGALSEQQLGMTLLRCLTRKDPADFFNFDGVLHHRTRTRKEIDFVGSAFGGAAIESRYVSGDRWRRAIPTLVASRWRGVVATRDAFDVRDPIAKAVPAGVLAWLLGG